MSDCSTPLSIPIEDLDQVLNAVGLHWERLRGQRLLLTGGTGFMGKWLLATFLHANRRLDLSAQVVVPSRRSEAFLNEFPELRDAPEVIWLTGDLRDLKLEAAYGCSYAIHAATDVVATRLPNEIFDICYAGTQRVLSALGKDGMATRMVLLSSGAVYGRTPPEMSAVPEEWQGAPDPLDPSSAYGEGKRVSEWLCAMAANARPEFEVSIARCFAFVGPHLSLDKHFAIGNFIGAAMNGQDIRIKGDGTPLRSYLYAADLVHWLWVLLFTAKSGRAYNVGGSEPLSIGDLAHRVNRVLNGSGDVLIALSPRPGVRPQAYVPSVDRIARELALTPSVSLDDAILRTARWARQYYSRD
jgi:nucleoside-diphosphate-sugar epimerase